jgi:citrate lyase subunit beta/citryl-CoA lyase
MAIHPSQLATIHAVFTPTADELAYARKVVDAFAQAEASGQAAIAVDGRLVDYPIAHKARWVLERAGE